MLFMQILSAKGETEEGISVLKLALELEPDSQPVKSELNRLLSRKRQDTALQRDLYKKMLGTIKTEAEKEMEPPGNSVSLKNVYLIIQHIVYDELL